MAESSTPHSMNGAQADDPFNKFSLLPPKPMGKYRPYARRTKFRAMTAMRLTSSRGSITGSTQDMLDPVQLMSLQEDAKSRRISSEILKHHLYESVVLPTQRRRKLSLLNSSYMDGFTRPSEDLHTDEVTQFYMHPTRMAISVPVTPVVSNRTTPCHSPTQNRSFMFSLFPRHSEEEEGKETEEAEMTGSNVGLASLFSPMPRCVPAAKWIRKVDKEKEDGANVESSVIGQSIKLQDPPKAKIKASKQRSPSPMDHEAS